MDEEKNKSVGSPYGITGFPTLKWFGFDKKKPIAYESGRDADSIRKWALSQIKKEVDNRMDGGSKSGSSKSKSKGPATDKDVIILEDSNFDETVFKSKDVWLIEFYAPWCGHCKALEPEWNEAAKALKGSVKLAKVDCTENEGLARKFGVSGYPTIKFFEYGLPKKASSAKDYQGERKAPGIIEFANSLLNDADIEPEIHEIVNQAVYDENCSGATVCVISILPNIYESNAAERNQYL
jgi:protein disulfide-isomerase A6